MKVVAIAGWLLADLALILFVVGVADVGPTPTTTTTTSTTMTAPPPPPPPPPTEPSGIDPPVEFRLTGVTPERVANDRQALGDEIELRLRDVGALDREGAVILVFSKWGASSDTSKALSAQVNVLLRERFGELTAEAQMRDYVQGGDQGDVKIELFLLR